MTIGGTNQLFIMLPCFREGGSAACLSAGAEPEDSDTDP